LQKHWAANRSPSILCASFRKIPRRPKRFAGCARFADSFPRVPEICRCQRWPIFLQAAGFTIAAAAMPGCSRPPERSRVTHLVQPEVASPGERLQYATTCPGCSAGCGVLASVRDGRPVKLEGLPGHPVSQGGLCAAGQASILGLYDGKRFRQPRLDGKPVADRLLAFGARMRRWTGDVSLALDEARRAGQRILIEGAQGAMLDIDHGTYPYATSSNATIGGACTGLGIPPKAIHGVLGVAKAYPTRGAEGPLPMGRIGGVGQRQRERGMKCGPPQWMSEMCAIWKTRSCSAMVEV